MILPPHNFVLLQSGSSPWDAIPLANMHLLQHRILQGLQHEYLLHHGLQGNTFSFPSYLAVCTAVLTLFSPPALPVWQFLPFLKYIFTGMPPALLIGSALASSGSVLEPSVTGTGQSFHTEVTPEPPHYQNIAM